MRTGASDFFEGSLMPESDAAPAGPNPYWQGCRVVDRDDLFPKGFSQVELDAAYASLANDTHDLGLLLESPTLDEMEYYNPGREDVEEAYVLEAITVDHFSRTERRMTAVVRVLNRHLSDSEITALPPVVGKPKKSGSFAYVIVQLPFTDGQTVNVVFHSPEGDKKRIGPSDAIIAFRWLLNKRDITHVVAPEDGEEVSLESIAKRITQLVVKNSKRFERQQKAAQAERKELDETREAVKGAEERQSELMEKVSAMAKEAETVEARLSNTLSLLEKQKTINAELESKIEALRSQKQGAGTANGNDLAAAMRMAEQLGREAGERNFTGEAGDYPGMRDIITSVPATKWKEVEAAWQQARQEAASKQPPAGGNTTTAGTGGTSGATQQAPDGTVDKDGVYIKHDGWWYTRGQDGQPKDRLAVSFQDRLEKEWRDSQGKPAGAENQTEPAFVSDLRDIIAGKYDADTEKVLSLLEAAIAAAEKDGTLEKYDAMLNEASNHLTDLLAKEAA